MLSVPPQAVPAPLGECVVGALSATQLRWLWRAFARDGATVETLWHGGVRLCLVHAGPRLATVSQRWPKRALRCAKGAHVRNVAEVAKSRKVARDATQEQQMQQNNEGISHADGATAFTVVFRGLRVQCDSVEHVVEAVKALAPLEREVPVPMRRRPTLGRR
jgi:hypothetical protein